ncbi:MAG: glucosamine-6-phosphate deaminase [Sphaerochaetaceae bacterium]
MNIEIFDTGENMGQHAAMQGAIYIREALKRNESISIIVATGASQFSMLNSLVIEKDIDWSKVEVFHLDEYVGISADHKASFRRYLKERFEQKVGCVKAFHYIEGDAEDLNKEVERISSLIREKEIAVAFIGIGENGHIAFNDPPADLTTDDPYLVVDLDTPCRAQQVGEGWFSSIEEVPSQAISMSIRQILKSKVIICSVPDERKADAVHMALNSPVIPRYPCASLREHKNCYLFTDRMSAGKILRK